MVEQSYTESSDMEGRLEMLKKAEETFSGPDGNAFFADLTKDQIELLKFQQGLEKRQGKKFVDLSIGDTIFELIRSGAHDQAERLKKSVSEKRFWCIKIKGFVWLAFRSQV